MYIPRCTFDRDSLKYRTKFWMQIEFLYCVSKFMRIFFDLTWSNDTHYSNKKKSNIKCNKTDIFLLIQAAKFSSKNYYFNSLLFFNIRVTRIFLHMQCMWDGVTLRKLAKWATFIYGTALWAINAHREFYHKINIFS